MESELNDVFDNLWQIFLESNNSHLAWVKGIKEICREFFEQGVKYVDVPQQPIIGDESFETWWSIYDKKIDKSGCLKKWNKLTRKEQQECLRLTPAYVASTPVKQFRKHPRTYLNNKSWQDEIITTDNGNIHDQSLRVISRLYQERQMDSEVR